MDISAKRVYSLEEFQLEYEKVSKEKGVRLIEVIVEKNDIPRILRG